ncbi:hypothetical protein O1611_g8804 [Lasiodiplodia mahajangana]|uniref:Uncharacterized protein n=1 Tax=Lasiodiplodia mahajangana TaxID=1108764 RepID=A0ACC2JBI5_9PEZI|nr:hypothetical protein O1611_g8804 [Lasiodiplodia mahajangana]
MRQSQALVLLGIIAQNGIAQASSLPRGVGPEFVKFYEIKDTFACIAHPSIVIKASQVNDNTCDCPDGSDEPGTAACALLDSLSPVQPLPASLSGTTNTTNALPGFWCANKGHIGAYRGIWKGWRREVRKQVRRDWQGVAARREGAQGQLRASQQEAAYHGQRV